MQEGPGELKEAQAGMWLDKAGILTYTDSNSNKQKHMLDHRHRETESWRLFSAL